MTKSTQRGHSLEVVQRVNCNSFNNRVKLQLYIHNNHSTLIIFGFSPTVRRLCLPVGLCTLLSTFKATEIQMK